MIPSVSSSTLVNLPTVEVKGIVGLNWLLQITYCMQGKVQQISSLIKRGVLKDPILPGEKIRESGGRDFPVLTRMGCVHWVVCMAYPPGVLMRNV